jgi:hypothetical protein
VVARAYSPASGADDVPNKRAEGIHLAKFGVDRDLWGKALAKAASEDRSLSAVLREFLEGYVDS